MADPIQGALAGIQGAFAGKASGEESARRRDEESRRMQLAENQMDAEQQWRFHQAKQSLFATVEDIKERQLTRRMNVLQFTERLNLDRDKYISDKLYQQKALGNSETQIMLDTAAVALDYERVAQAHATARNELAGQLTGEDADEIDAVMDLVGIPLKEQASKLQLLHSTIQILSQHGASGSEEFLNKASAVITAAGAGAAGGYGSLVTILDAISRADAARSGGNLDGASFWTQTALDAMDSNSFRLNNESAGVSDDDVKVYTQKIMALDAEISAIKGRFAGDPLADTQGIKSLLEAKWLEKGIFHLKYQKATGAISPPGSSITHGVLRQLSFQFGNEIAAQPPIAVYGEDDTLEDIDLLKYDQVVTPDLLKDALPGWLGGTYNHVPFGAAPTTEQQDVFEKLGKEPKSPGSLYAVKGLDGMRYAYFSDKGRLSPELEKEAIEKAIPIPKDMEEEWTDAIPRIGIKEIMPGADPFRAGFLGQSMMMMGEEQESKKVSPHAFYSGEDMPEYHRRLTTEKLDALGGGTIRSQDVSRYGALIDSIASKLGDIATSGTQDERNTMLTDASKQIVEAILPTLTNTNFTGVGVEGLKKYAGRLDSSLAKEDVFPLTKELLMAHSNEEIRNAATAATSSEHLEMLLTVAGARVRAAPPTAGVLDEVEARLGSAPSFGNETQLQSLMSRIFSRVAPQE